jgi:hypothetical protein
VKAEAIYAAQGRSPIIVDEMLRETKPSEIPVEQLTKFEVVIRLKTAKAIGLIVPPARPTGDRLSLLFLLRRMNPEVAHSDGSQCGIIRTAPKPDMITFRWAETPGAPILRGALNHLRVRHLGLP